MVIQLFKKNKTIGILKQVIIKIAWQLHESSRVLHILIIFLRQYFIHISELFQFAMKFKHLYSLLNAKLIVAENLQPIFFCYFFLFFFNLSHVILGNLLKII